MAAAKSSVMVGSNLATCDHKPIQSSGAQSDSIGQTFEQLGRHSRHGRLPRVPDSRDPEEEAEGQQHSQNQVED